MAGECENHSSQLFICGVSLRTTAQAIAIGEMVPKHGAAANPARAEGILGYDIGDERAIVSG